MADFVIKQGDTAPPFAEYLHWADGSVVDLQEGGKAELVLRNLSSPRPVRLANKTLIFDPPAGGVRYSWAASDTAEAGTYAASWRVTLGIADREHEVGETRSFPEEGYLEIVIEPSLTAESRQLVSLGEIKEKMFIADNNHKHDNWFMGEIEAVRPLIEEVTGPIIPQIYDEKYDGGSNVISLLHAPTYGWATEPILNLLGVSEFRGPAEFQLSIVSDPVYGSIYSCELGPEIGEITRRTAGGGTIAFMPGRSSIHIIYQAGLASVPANVKRAAVEAIRWNFETTQAVGKGAMTVADSENQKPMAALPYHTIAMLKPTKRAPSIG